MITPDQIRAARALKGWSQGELAARTGLAVPTIANIEISKQEPSVKTMDKIIQTFEANGIEFIGDRGVQKKQSQTRVFKGQDDFKEFYNVIYNSLQNKNEEILVGNVDEREFIRNLDDETLILHRDRMLSVKAHYRILICENDYYFAANKYAEYRWLNKEDFSSIPFYVFADKLAIILWLDEPLVFLIDDANAANVYREKFEGQWKSAIKPKNKELVTSYEPGDKERLAIETNKKAGK